MEKVFYCIENKLSFVRLSGSIKEIEVFINNNDDYEFDANTCRS